MACCLSMKVKRKAFLEVATGLSLFAIGLILRWWSAQLVWILTYPQPLAKYLIEIIIRIFWAIGVILVVDCFRRLPTQNQARSIRDELPHLDLF